jgi:hypothetical protein
MKGKKYHIRLTKTERGLCCGISVTDTTGLDTGSKIDCHRTVSQSGKVVPVMDNRKFELIIQYGEKVNFCGIIHHFQCSPCGVKIPFGVILNVRQLAKMRP